MRYEKPRELEWPTLALMVVCYSGWAAATTVLAAWWLPLAFIVTTLMITLHSSLQHEVLHGHPFRNRLLNEALVSLPLGLICPYERFRDLHLAHHRDEHLTDPYDDPESNFQDPAVWHRLSRPMQIMLRVNNTLLGRMVLGPAIGMAAFMSGDMRALRGGDRKVLRAWVLHAVWAVPLVLWVYYAAMPFWLYLLACYCGMSVLKIRTFLEHRAHELARGRSVVVEQGVVLPLLFLNNNLHAVHHCKPNLAWYRLPALYAAQREEFLRRNGGYVYRSYLAVFRAHLLRAKDPVPHPLRPQG